MDVDKLEETKEALWQARLYLDNLVELKCDIPNLKEIVKTIEKKEKEVKKQLDSIRKKCSHNWEYGGHGHNDDWYVCTICGETEDR